MRTPSSSVLAALVALASSFLSLPALAHSDVRDAIPDETGGKVGVSLAASSLSANRALSSQGLPGYLLLGDAGVDRRGFQLEHGVAQLGYRFSDATGAELALGAHGSDPVHVEAAWLQGRGSFGGADWTVGAGRQNPSLGPVMTPAGHMDRFGAMPLAKQAALNGDWIENGVEAGLTGHVDDVSLALDLGLWLARAFPGAKSGSPAPSIHLGAQWDSAAGPLTFDAFWSRLRPVGRGSRINSSTGAHTHVAPQCDASLNQIVCFDGRSDVAGLSARWDVGEGREGRDGPLTLTGAVMWRNEDGQLQSRNGVGDYAARNRGDWVQGVWRWADQWELGVRHERLMARQLLQGLGAALLADEAGFGRYAPQRRTAAQLGYALSPWADLRVEGGRERAGPDTVRYLAVRLLVKWDRGFAAP